MALYTGTSQGKRLSNEGLQFETLPVLSGSFIAGCKIAGFFPGVVLGVVAWRSELVASSRPPPLP